MFMATVYIFMFYTEMYVNYYGKDDFILMQVIIKWVCFKVQHLNNFQTIFSWCRHGKTHVEWLWNYGKVYYPSGSLVSSSGPWAQGPLQPDTHTKQKKKPKVMYRNTDAHEHIPEDAVIMWLQNTLWRDNASHIQ